MRASDGTGRHLRLRGVGHYDVRVRVPPRPQKLGTWRSGLARRAYIAKVRGSNPLVPTEQNAAVAHVVERSSEKAEVASASLARGTLRPAKAGLSAGVV